MKDFVIKHQKAILIISFIVIASVVLFLFAQTPISQETEDGNLKSGPDGAGEVYGLPISNSIYSINFAKKQDGSDDPTALNIVAPAGYRSIAMKKLFETNINPTDYKINFYTESPFSRYEK